MMSKKNLEVLKKQQKRQKQQKAKISKKWQEWRKQQAKACCSRVLSNLKQVCGMLPKSEQKAFNSSAKEYVRHLQSLLTMSDEEIKAARKRYNALAGAANNESTKRDLKTDEEIKAARKRYNAPHGPANNESTKRDLKTLVTDGFKAVGYIWLDMLTRPRHLFDPFLFDGFGEAENAMWDTIGKEFSDDPRIGGEMREKCQDQFRYALDTLKELNRLAYDCLDEDVLLDRAHGGEGLEALGNMNGGVQTLYEKAVNEWNALQADKAWKDELGTQADEFQVAMTKYLAYVTELITIREPAKGKIQGYLDCMNKLTKYKAFSKSALYQTFCRLNEELIRGFNLENNRKMKPYRAAPLRQFLFAEPGKILAVGGENQNTPRQGFTGLTQTNPPNNPLLRVSQ